MNDASHLPTERCNQSRQLNAELWKHFEPAAPLLPRHAVSTAALLLAHEHHSAISKLILSEHFGSAVTLIRPLVEAVTTAAWAIYVAPIPKIEETFFGDGKLPPPSAMLSQLTKVKGIGAKVSLKDLMDGPGKTFHEFTHGDVMQLKRRFNNVGTTFLLQENLSTLLIADLMLMYGGSVLHLMRPTAALENLLRSRTNEVVASIQKEAEKGAVPVWDGWTQFPEPTIDQGKIPESAEVLYAAYTARLDERKRHIHPRRKKNLFPKNSPR